MTTLPSLLTLRVDDARLIAEVGKLFGSPADALAEVLQNAHRAGATRLRIDVEADGRTLTLTDNGPGLEDPRLLFDIARSGWGAGIASDPAGMGAVALYALCERVVITSRPQIGVPWRVEFGQEVFAGVAFSPQPVSELGNHGLSVRGTFKPEVNVEQLLRGGWRHRYPIEVVLARGGDERIVPPAARYSGPVVPTAVGAVTIASRTVAPSYYSRAIWEHRIALIPGDDLVTRIVAELDHRPGSLAGAIVRTALVGAVVEWEMDTRATGACPRLPDRTHLIDDAALETAVATITDALLAEVDEGALLDACAEHIGGRTIVEDPAEAAVFGARGSLGRLACSARLADTVPFLGYHGAHRAAAMDAVSVSLWVSGDEDHVAWGDLTHRVWVRPAYATRSYAAAALALADGWAAVPADVLPADDAPLPQLLIEADSLVALASVGQIFATNLRYEVDGAVLGPVRHAYSRRMLDEGAHHALSERWTRAVETIPVGPMAVPSADDDDTLEYWVGLHPLPEGVGVVDYARSSADFSRQVLAESEYDEWPVYFWDFANAPERDAGEDGVLLHVLTLLARELGPATAFRVEREIEAADLVKTCANLAGKVGRALVQRRVRAEGGSGGSGYEGRRALQEATDHWSLAPDLLRDIEEAAGRLCTLLDEVTLPRLLDDAPPRRPGRDGEREKVGWHHGNSRRTPSAPKDA